MIATSSCALAAVLVLRIARRCIERELIRTRLLAR
jgi:hypothetical protein